jgi:hypothetical protein
MPYQTVTLADLKVDLADRTDESLAINEALRLWNLLTGRWRRTIQLAVVANQIEYTLPSTMTYSMRVALGTIPVHPTSYLELDLARPTWRTETTASGGGVPTAITLWAPLSLKQIAVWPADALGAPQPLIVEGVSDTPVLLQDADTVDLGEEDQDDLVEFALHVVAFKEGGPRWRATRPALVTLLQAAAQENGRLKANQAFRRYAGLDLRRTLQPLKGVPTQLDALAAKEPA